MVTPEVGDLRDQLSEEEVGNGPGSEFRVVDAIVAVDLANPVVELLLGRQLAHASHDGSELRPVNLSVDVEHLEDLLQHRG